MSVESNESGEGGKKAYNFGEAAFVFDDEEREKARDLIGQIDEIKEYWSKDIDFYEYTIDQIRELVSEIGEKVAMETKIYHGLSGSSLPEEKWKSISLDTEDHDFEKLIENIIVPELERRRAA